MSGTLSRFFNTSPVSFDRDAALVEYLVNDLGALDQVLEISQI